MNTTAAQREKSFNSGTAAGASEDPLNLVLIYDHEECAASARRQVLPVILRPVPDLELHCEEWSFGELANARCADEAVEMAAGCDIIIIATSHGDQLPVHVLEWLGQWLDGPREKEAALISLVGSSRGATLNSAVQTYLCSLAQERGLAFFASAFELPRNLAGDAREHHFHTWSPRPERFGINE